MVVNSLVVTRNSVKCFLCASMLWLGNLYATVMFYFCKMLLMCSMLWMWNLYAYVKFQFCTMSLMCFYDLDVEFVWLCQVSVLSNVSYVFICFGCEVCMLMCSFRSV